MTVFNGAGVGAEQVGAMNTDKLVAMANQISAYFQSYPDVEGVAGVRDHIIDFWTPKMVAALRERAANDPAGLHRLVVGAMLAAPSGATSPADKAMEDATELGLLASDAG